MLALVQRREPLEDDAGTMNHVEIGLHGDRVPYIRGGSGEREAMVFFGVNALFRRLEKTTAPERYVRQVARLLPGHRVTILGYAGSSFDEIVRDMAQVIRTPPDVIVGISLGGFVAMRCAAQHPELVRRLVLLASAHRFSPGGWRMLERQVEALERGDFPTLVRENALLFRRPWYNWLVRLKLWKDGHRLAADFRDPAAILQDYRQLFGPEFTQNAEYARRVVCPTLVIGGTADQLFDRTAFEETASLIPGARLHLVDQETHMVPIERSDIVAGAIAQFLKPGP
jgi:pimeloyl-ACP methyl ester carboxylesterase